MAQHPDPSHIRNHSSDSVPTRRASHSLRHRQLEIRKRPCPHELPSRELRRLQVAFGTIQVDRPRWKWQPHHLVGVHEKCVALHLLSNRIQTALIGNQIALYGSRQRWARRRRLWLNRPRNSRYRTARPNKLSKLPASAVTISAASSIPIIRRTNGATS